MGLAGEQLGIEGVAPVRIPLTPGARRINETLFEERRRRLAENRLGPDVHLVPNVGYVSPEDFLKYQARLRKAAEREQKERLMVSFMLNQDWAPEE